MDKIRKILICLLTIILFCLKFRSGKKSHIEIIEENIKGLETTLWSGKPHQDFQLNKKEIDTLLQSIIPLALT